MGVSTSLLLLAAVIGLVIGAAATWAMLRAESRGPRDADGPLPVVPEPAAEVLAILSSAYVVLDSSGDVLRASPWPTPTASCAPPAATTRGWPAAS